MAEGLVLLRPYQREALDALRRALKPDHAPVVVLPTGAGKGHILSEIAAGCAAKGRRLLVLAHVAELVSQNAAQCERGAAGLVGVYSAGLGRRDTGSLITCAGIQSVYSRACELGAVGLIIIDECHLLQPEGEGMYGQFLGEARTVSPSVLVAGLTATPYRMGSGLIYGDEGQMFDGVAYRASMADLIADGYLSPLMSRAPASGCARVDLDGVQRSGGDYVQSQLEARVDTDELVRDSVADMLRQCQASEVKSCLIFAVGIAHADHIVEAIKDRGHKADAIFGTTGKEQRSEVIASFRAGALRFLVNVGVLTTGFDAPAVDCVAIFRPTKSAGLFYQMVGRGLRLAPNKTRCLILDYGRNIDEHGPVDMLDDVDHKAKKSNKKTARECPKCGAHSSYSRLDCSECGHEFTRQCRQCGVDVKLSERKCPACGAQVILRAIDHDSRPSEMSILSGGEAVRVEISAVCYSEHHKKGSDPDVEKNWTMRVDYLSATKTLSEWVCPNHVGYARKKFEKWWAQRSAAEIPSDLQQALYLAERGALAAPVAIYVCQEGKYQRVGGYELPDIDEKWTLSSVPTNNTSEDNVEDNW